MKYIILIFTALILSFSCKKSDSKFTEITSKTWKPLLSDKNPSSNPSGAVLYYAFSECEKYDTYSFGTDGKLTIAHRAPTCNYTSATTVLNYTYNTSTKELVVDGVKYILAEQTASQLKYYTVVSSASGSQNLIFIFQ